MHVSNFRKVKRIQDILKTFKAVSEKIDSKLLLIGDGPELSNMRRCAEQLSISDKVLFLGKREQVAPLYQMADLFLLMSEKESFGLVLLEAMHSGVVCIGTTAGGIKEVIKHEETGYIVDVGDTQAAAEYALALLTDDILYERFQKNMIDDINSRFSSEHITNQYEAIYRNLIEGVRQ